MYFEMKRVFFPLSRQLLPKFTYSNYEDENFIQNLIEKRPEKNFRTISLPFFLTRVEDMWPNEKFTKKSLNLGLLLLIDLESV